MVPAAHVGMAAGLESLSTAYDEANRMEGRPMARIVDVASHAGVSTATVSRVLNGKTVNPELAARVRSSVDLLGYVPDRTARSLRRRASDVVALVLPDVENPFFTAVARGVEDVAHGAGYSVVLCNTDDDPAKEAHYLTVAEHENMAGVLIAPATDSPALDALQARGRGLVVVDRRIDDAVDQVAFDNEELGYRVTNTLIRQGFRRIACVTGPRSTSTAVERANGWRRALAEADLAAEEELLVHANFRVDGGYAALSGLLAQSDPPEAVAATNNLVGVGVLRALADAHGTPARTAGRAEHTDKGPEASGPAIGIGIIGDLPFATSRTTDIHLVPLNPRELGMAAAHLLLERFADPGRPARSVVQAVPAPGSPLSR
ncbi:LacI family DNA-binding transcriptional regulator [Ruania halotolerans]|uniref:LacI family DNA-binding transcriptional regulator n=1 Tax=Ruania halotolerans TaxID=2897773 RepID=UPI001E2D7186|nr:LacI family DNA-binding transcriptional regulator [Ruania halotolerans]UFU05894.1 LacI family transcriptional regulator [Ruania halotolerans]